MALQVRAPPPVLSRHALLLQQGPEALPGCGPAPVSRCLRVTPGRPKALLEKALAQLSRRILRSQP